MPRLSVDIDLTYLPVQPRPESLAAIEAALARIAKRVKATIRGSQVTESRTSEGTLTKLFVKAEGVQILTEVTPVLRGCVFEPKTLSVSPAVEEEFGFAEIKVVSFADLYAGKLVAALDRQHPRDLFDVRDLFANEGLSDDLRRAFIVYLISHDRPMFEVLTARRKDIEAEFKRGFEGMTDDPIPLKELTDAREALVLKVVGEMPDAHRQFLMSFERGQPDWALLNVKGAADLPAVRWRQLHLDKLSADKRRALVERLKEVLEVDG